VTNLEICGKLLDDGVTLDGARAHAAQGHAEHVRPAVHSTRAAGTRGSQLRAKGFMQVRKPFCDGGGGRGGGGGAVLTTTATAPHTSKHNMMHERNGSGLRVSEKKRSEQEEKACRQGPTA